MFPLSAINPDLQLTVILAPWGIGKLAVVFRVVQSAGKPVHSSADTPIVPEKKLNRDFSIT